MAKGSQNSWGPAEREAARACPGCGARVVLTQHSMSRTDEDGTVVWHESCLPWSVRVVVEASG